MCKLIKLGNYHHLNVPTNMIENADFYHMEPSH